MAESKNPSPRAYIASSPLWTRAPARDEHGIPCIDFMMIIPGLSSGDAALVEARMLALRDCLGGFDDLITYVDLNVRLNLLWVSTRRKPGIILTLVEAIRQRIPDARVVAGDFNPEPPARRSGWLWLGRLGTRLSRLAAPYRRLK
jgi:hypothetical protein